ncbi:hypothetical protein [Citreimonas sp.]|uniref:hypothetical protein n=1 Tax=Citreimonas sp. TaxID=3036715 RepID=UPI0040597946
MLCEVALRASLRVRAAIGSSPNARSGETLPACGSAPRLAGGGQSLYPRVMVSFFDRSDRARLRERFHGAMHSVLARL